MIKKIQIFDGKGSVRHQFEAKEGMELDISDCSDYIFRGMGPVISIWDFKPGKVGFWRSGGTRDLIATIPSFQDTAVIIERD